jgi:DNA helicase II / ATP-dependent DNA helicase PcrA
MTLELASVLARLSDIQREATLWQEGSALVLAGPGSGKTRVLTARIARLLDESRKRNFRILALTFTTKAAAEMRERVEHLVPGLAERSFIGTFHAFCTQLLRQHGSHIGIAPDFSILDQEVDRTAILNDALLAAAARGEQVTAEDVRWLRTIDQLKARLVVPEKVQTQLRDPVAVEIVTKVYSIYERALADRNSTDFNGLILGACRLFRDVPGVAERTRKTYLYWLIDEFQDTSPAQYRLIQLAAGDSFKNLFAVADDDQIIYQWAGASYRQIEKLRADFKPALIQLVENHRCPSEIVSAANLLVAKNTFRTPNKKPLVAAKRGTPDSIRLRIFDSDTEECDGIAKEIAAESAAARGQTAILGRTRSLLDAFHRVLQTKGVKATIAQRRDRFISPQFTWLQACLDQALRPTDERMFNVLVDAANRVIGEQLDPAILKAQAEAAGLAYFEHWAKVSVTLSNPLARTLGEYAVLLSEARSSWRKVVRQAIPTLLESAGQSEGVITDAADDKAAWDACLKEIRAEKGAELDLDELIQGLALRSKEPPHDPEAVTLMTVHAAKGLEFDIVFVVGLAESVMPAWQSVNKGDASPEMEEERRNCFVAITRTRERLTLSYAKTYRGWNRRPSRFLAEMGLAQSTKT